MPQGRDAIKLNAKRSYTSEGYLIAPAVLARSGILPYYAVELGLTDRAPNQLVQVYRSPDELAKSAPSFDHKPITMDHPPDGIDASTWRELAVGDVHDVNADKDQMHATIIVRDKAAIDEINKGRRQLSNGYSFELRKAADSAKGYEFEQVDIQGNHIAIVDRARCGPSCVVGDRDPITTHMEGRPMIKITMDGYPGEVDEQTAAIIIQRLQREVADAALKKPMVTVKGKQLDEAEVNAALEQKDVEIKNLKDSALTPEQFKQQYAAEQKVISFIKDLVPKMQIADGADIKAVCGDALRQLEAKDENTKNQIAAVLDGVAIDKATAVDLQRAIRTMHAATAADRARQQSHSFTTELGHGLLKGEDDISSRTVDGRKLSGRDLWVYRQTHMMDSKSNDSEQGGS